MATFLLNTIALDPNRWTPTKTPYCTLTDLLPAVAEAGFRRLELWHYHLSTLDAAAADELERALQAEEIQVDVLGLYPKLHLTGTAREAEAAELQRLIRLADRLGVGLVKCFAGALGTDAVDADTFDRSVAFLQMLAEVAGAHGLLLALETHPDTLADSVAACRRLLAAVDRSNVRLCFQPFDFADTDQAIADYEALHAHVAHVHLQGRRGDRMSLLEAADLDYRLLFERFAAHGFSGPLSLEFVEGCVVEDPAAFDLGAVLQTAQRDRAYVYRLAEETGLALR